MNGRKLRAFAAGVFLMGILIALSGCQNEKTQWTLDEALKLVGTEQAAQMNGWIPLEGDFSMYDPVGGWDYSPDDGKILILWRESPEKEYSRSSFPFDDSYRGEDLSEPKVWLRADLMERIPEYLRAENVEEAGNILMAEIGYYFDNMLLSSGSVRQPSEPGIEYERKFFVDDGMNTDEYRPLFVAAASVCLYNMETKERLVGPVRSFPYAELRDNPEAADLWQEMLLLLETADAMTLGSKNDRLESGRIDVNLLYYYAALDEQALEELSGLIERDEREAVVRFCLDAFWEKAAQFIELDPDFEDEYRTIIRLQSVEELAELVHTRSFSYVALTNEEILIRKAYMGTPDPAVLETLLSGVISELDQADWNLEKIYFWTEDCLGG